MTVTKKQTSIAIFAAVFVTAMIVGTLVSATSDNMAFATHKKISQKSHSSQKSFCNASGGVAIGNGLFLGPFADGGENENSCNNTSTQNNANSGNN